MYDDWHHARWQTLRCIQNGETIGGNPFWKNESFFIKTKGFMKTLGRMPPTQVSFIKRRYSGGEKLVFMFLKGKWF